MTYLHAAVNMWVLLAPARMIILRTILSGQIEEAPEDDDLELHAALLLDRLRWE